MQTRPPEQTTPESQPQDDAVAAFREELANLAGETPPPPGPAVDPADFMPKISKKAQRYINNATQRHPSSGNAIPPTRQP